MLIIADVTVGIIMTNRIVMMAIATNGAGKHHHDRMTHITESEHVSTV